MRALAQGVGDAMRDAEMTDDVIAKARAHAHKAAIHSKLKGIARSDAGVCFMAEGLILLYEIDFPQAAKLVQQLLPHIHDLLEQEQQCPQ
jgi:hypothetical protein